MQEVEDLRKRVEELESQVFFMKEMVLELQEVIREMSEQKDRRVLMFVPPGWVPPISQSQPSLSLPVPQPSLVHEEPRGDKFYVDSDKEEEK